MAALVAHSKQRRVHLSGLKKLKRYITQRDMFPFRDRHGSSHRFEMETLTPPHHVRFRRCSDSIMQSRQQAHQFTQPQAMANNSSVSTNETSGLANTPYADSLVCHEDVSGVPNKYLKEPRIIPHAFTTRPQLWEASRELSQSHQDFFGRTSVMLMDRWFFLIPHRHRHWRQTSKSYKSSMFL